eukprot:2386-Heterococcus_DN1.PRE.10
MQRHSIQAEAASAYAALQHCTLARESLDCWLHRPRDQQSTSAVLAEHRENLVCLVHNLTLRLQELHEASPLLLNTVDVLQVCGLEHAAKALPFWHSCPCMMTSTEQLLITH